MISMEMSKVRHIKVVEISKEWVKLKHVYSELSINLQISTEHLLRDSEQHFSFMCVGVGVFKLDSNQTLGSIEKKNNVQTGFY